MDEIQRIIMDADEEGLRLEVVNGLGVWEPSPVLSHQKKVDAIRETIRPANPAEPCSCVHYADVLVAFPGGSQKRPDIAIFCREPDEQDTAITLLPEAVIEVLSINWKVKDWVIGVPLYLNAGVKDTVLFDSETGDVVHFMGAFDAEVHESPISLTLQCGCVCTV